MQQPLACPMKMETLLVCTDGSPNSQGAINAALALAKACQSRVRLLEVLDINVELEAQAPLWMPKLEDEIHKYLGTARHNAEKLGVPLEYQVRRSASPAEGILEEAQELKPDLIIMGRRGRSRVFRLMMGNVTARVIGHAPYHVLVVPAETPLDFKKILIASDGSPNSYAAWDEAMHIARRLGSELTAVSVAREDREVKTAEAVGGKLKGEAERQNVNLATQVLHGRPAEAIVKAAREQQMDLIVLGVLGASGLKSLLMGSVTERVIADTPCPVLVVQEAKPE